MVAPVLGWSVTPSQVVPAYSLTPTYGAKTYVRSSPATATHMVGAVIVIIIHIVIIIDSDQGCHHGRYTEN